MCSCFPCYFFIWCFTDKHPTVKAENRYISCCKLRDYWLKVLLKEVLCSVSPFAWNSSRVKNALLLDIACRCSLIKLKTNAEVPFTIILFAHWISLLSSIAWDGKDWKKDWNLKKFASVFEFGCNICIPKKKIYCRLRFVSKIHNNKLLLLFLWSSLSSWGTLL